MKKWTIRAGLVVAAAALAAGQEPGSTQAEKQFDQLCEGCHGEGGEGGDRAPALVNNRRLRSRNTTQIQDLIKNGTTGGMPAFPLPEKELQSLAAWVHSFNASAYSDRPAGDVDSGSNYFSAAESARRATWSTAMERRTAPIFPILA